MKPYNGHRSYNAWNVALWIENDKGLYHFALDCLKCGDLHKATRKFMSELGGQRTPDGALYNTLSVKLALEGLQED